MKFRAALLERPRSPLVIADVTLAPLQAHDVLVRLGASGFCHTDLEVIDGALARPMPIVLGHEGAGVVHAVGTAVSRVRPGDHVVCSWNPSCGACYYCERSLPILCERVTSLHPRGMLSDGARRLSVDDRPVNHFSMVSSHAEYCVVPEAGAIPVSHDIPFDRACLIGCGVMTGYGAATRVAPVTAGSDVVVVGCGAVGLNAIQGAAANGAGTIIGIDSVPERLDLALELGATHAISGSASELVSEVKRLTGGRGAAFVFESAGHANAMALALECARPGGDVVILGKVPVDEAVTFRFGSMMGEKRITRSSYGGARPERDFPALARAYLDGKLKLDELIGRRVPLDAINDAVEAMRHGQIGRTVIVFP
jgi:S-(hydroxymethyl)glutathione dehydrogenase/alcohol dehydrogenase